MTLNPLTAISPIDGRYHAKTKKLAEYFSEFGLIRYRVQIEIEYFIALSQTEIPIFKNFPVNKLADLRAIYLNFTEEDANWIKNSEKITNHDVKAVEYFLKDKMKSLGLVSFLEYIHFGLTSQDINNTAIPLSLKEGIQKIYLPQIHDLIAILNRYKQEWKEIPMLAKTHGQAATPSRLGKEIQVFSERIENQLKQLEQIPYSAKFGGATGNFNAHFVAFPEIDWVLFANNFVNSTLGLSRSKTTTQIEHYDNLAALFDCLKRINTIILDLNRDMWTYISMDYFKQKLKDGEIGSSAMPHKVNPIDFENSEGNIGLANAVFEHLSSKLPVSRLQRDLTDSTVLRNIGVPLGHTLIALESCINGLNKLVINEIKIAEDLENNWAVVAEAIQTILRREGFEKPYEALKELTRKNEKISKESVHAFIDAIPVEEKIKNELKLISPHNYLGIQLVK
ncbi:MAG: adenylosuccinate lyase [Flavobacteriia bacterium]|nr:adenylosuccinate lyase [Flavobacteriia bacterium]